MNIRDLEYFIGLTEIKTFSKVARDFNVSQPTITFALKRLEKEMGAKLIIRHRTQRQLIVTDSGKQLLRHAKAIVNNYYLAQREIANLKQHKLKLGLPPVIENNYFAPIAKHLQQNHLLNKIDTYEYGSSSTLQALKGGEVDLALLGSINPLVDQDVIADEFDRQEFSIFVSKNNPLAKKKNGIYFKELKDQDFIALKTGFINNQALSILSKQNHFRPKISFRSTGIHSIMNMIGQDVGIGCFSSMFDSNRNDVVRLKLLDDDTPQFVTSVVYRQSHVFNNTQREILDDIKSTLNIK